MDLKQKYDADATFREYVDKYTCKERIDLDTALTHKVVQNYAQYLDDRGDSEIALANLWSESERRRDARR